MVQNILVGLAGWTVLALVAGLFLGNALRTLGQFDETPMPRRAALKKTA